MAITVSPTAGPPGTAVHIDVTGCNDPSGDNHAVSFNNDAENVRARNNPDAVRGIEPTQRGAALSATYRIVPADRTGGVGRFFVQCGATVEAATFDVTAR